MAAPSPWRMAIQERLEVGEATWDELVDVAAPLVPTGRAVRQMEYDRLRRSKGLHQRQPRPLWMRVQSGQRRVAYQCLHRAVANGAVIRDGDTCRLPKP